MKNTEKQFDFTPIGKTIKQVRLSRGMTRDEVSNLIDIDPRYLAHIENDGRCPSMEVFYRLISYFNIQVDQFFFDTNKSQRTSADLEALEYTIRQLDDDLLPIVQALVTSLLEHSNK